MIFAALLVCGLIVIYFVSFNAQIQTDGFLNEGESISRIKSLEDEFIKSVYLVKDEGGTPLRMVQVIESGGYNGLITLALTLDVIQDKLLAITILQHSETDTYGGYATQEWFLDRFADKDVYRDLKTVKMAAKAPEEIVAVTGATITSEGIVAGVNRGLRAYRKYKGEN